MILKKRPALIIILLVAAAVGLYPWQSMVVPEWKVRIVDQKGVPLANTGVREVWQDYSSETRSHQQDLVTDNDGYVSFPKRTIRSPFVLRIIKSAINSLNPHHSSGPDAFVIVLTSEYDTWSNNSAVPGQPLPKEVVVKKNR